MAETGYDILEIDEEFKPILCENECQELKPILKDFLQSYIEHKDTMEVQAWLKLELTKSYPETSEEEVEKISSEIVSSIKEVEEKKESLEQAIESGRSKESWFAEEVKKATAAMSVQESVQYLQRLDGALAQANESLYRTITTQAGNVSMNPCLDGFIAEQYHAQTFNLNAEATGSQYRAKVLEPNGNGYAKNSVDVVVVDGSGKVVRRYQSKYCRSVEATNAAFEQGDYRGQRKLVPEGQETGVKGSVNVIEAPDGITSNPLSKTSSEQLQYEAQSGNWNELNWNQYKTKDLAIGIGKQAGYAALQGAAIGVGFDVAKKVWEGEEIDSAEIIETALVTGTDFGVKAATAGALKVGVEKGIIKVIPKGTPAGVFANIAYIGIEDVKVLDKVMSGEYTWQEGVDKLEQTTISTAAGLAASAAGGAKLGAVIGTVLGPVGTAIGGFVGGTIGYMVGSKVGEAVVKASQKIREVAKKTVETIKDTVREGAREIYNGIKSGIKNIFLGWA